jgi:hypothetical protein
MSIDNIADYGYNWLSKELSDKVDHILAVLHLLPTSMAFHIPIMVKQTECGNYVITFKFTSEGNTFIEDVMIRIDAIIDLARFKPDAVNEYFSVMKEALDYSDMLRNKHNYNKVFCTEMSLCKQN